MRSKNNLKCFALILLPLLLVSCSPSKEKRLVTTREETEMVEEETITLEADSRQTLFVYDQALADKNEIILKLESEPLLLASEGYVRLVGVVSGGRPLALLEVGGRGHCVGLGEEVGGYIMAKISRKSVCLKKGGK